MILSAVNAHLLPDVRLQTTANLMLLHGVAALALCSLALATPRRGIWFIASAGMLLIGSVVFACDMTLRATLSARLFPMAAPIGGSLLILGWITVALSAAVALWPSHCGTETKILTND
jgi:uncharacterized membrane protein YgdD (TMEM256/DUF423 family)